MSETWEVIDPQGRKARLTPRAISHILGDHESKDAEYRLTLVEDAAKCIENPIYIARNSTREDDTRLHYVNLVETKLPTQYISVYTDTLREEVDTIIPNRKLPKPKGEILYGAYNAKDTSK